MANKEILQKVMEKMYFGAKEINIIECNDILRVDVYTMGGGDFPAISIPYQCIIFSHEFAKAFWGEKLLCYICKQPENNLHSSFCSKRVYSKDSDLIAWKYHLQQMVLWENPLHYLATFLKSDCCNAEIKYTENSGVYICPGIFCSKCKKLL